MPDWGAIAQVGASLFNTGSQVYQNAQNRKWALQDWNMQNAYNTPAQQMQRFKEAGLNPNLIYKQTNEAAPVRSTDYVAPQLGDFQGILSKSNQIKLQDQQFKNMELQNEAIKAQIEKTKADAIYTASNTNFRNLDTERLKGQLPGLVEGVQLRNLQYKAELDNKVADTQNKIAQLPILQVQKTKLDNEVERLIRSNAFIELSENQKLAVQRATVKSLQVATDLARKRNVTEDFSQQKIYTEILKNLRQQQDVPEDFVDKILGIAKGLIPKF